MGEYNNQIKTKDNFIGKRFDMLTVLERAPDKGGSVMWLCQCDCGSKPKIIKGSHLKNGKIKSCGCLRSKITSKRFFKGNKYDLSGEYGIGYINEDNSEFYFDLEDFDKIKDYTWYKNAYGYIESHSHYNDKAKPIIKLHNLIMGVYGRPFLVDHIGGSSTLTDNRKTNLRIVDATQNSMNRFIQSNNSSGVTGVCFAKNVNKWFARITLYGNTINLGYYEEYEDAVTARKVAEEKYFGKYSYSNSRKTGGDILSESLG